MKHRPSTRCRRGILIGFLVLLLPLHGAAQQDDVLVKAREAATSGRRAEALSLLEARLEQTPRDVDARLLYGLVLSWEKRYDQARSALSQVLAETPDYMDARVALMNVEYWSGRSNEALKLAEQVLTRDAGNVTARTVRERLEAAARPWWARTDYAVDAFDDGRDPWQEVSLSLTRRTPVGPVIVRGSHASRFGSSDQLFELEFYPRFRPGTYAYLEAGASTEHALYPETRFSFDLYQSLGRGYEVSGGARLLNFDTATHIYVATLAKYVGNWMLLGKIYRIPAEGDLDSTTYHGGFRRYYGSTGTSYCGFTYSHGLSREEVRGLLDLLSLNSDTVRGELDHLFATRVRLSISASTSRQERANSSPLWQTTVSAGLSVQF